jgi:hypothetical protein
MAMFNSYVKLPEGIMIYDELYDELWHATADLSLVNSL